MAPTLLLGLPPELRLYIYRYVFEDSVIFVCPRKRLAKSSDVGLLLTCRLCHTEARSIFWKETRVEGCRDGEKCNYDLFARGHSLSEFAKAHIRHIRGVCCDRDRQVVQKIIRQFPQLETCRVISSIICLWDSYRHSRDPGHRHDQLLFNDVVRYCMKMDPHKYVQEAYGIDIATSKVTFFTSIEVHSRPSEMITRISTTTCTGWNNITNITLDVLDQFQHQKVYIQSIHNRGGSKGHTKEHKRY